LATEAARQAVRVAERVRPAVIWAATPHLNGLVGLALSEALGVPLVYDVRGFPEMSWAAREVGREGATGHQLRRQAETRIMHDADLVVTLAPTMNAEIVGRGIAPGKVRILPHAVDVDGLASGNGARVRRLHRLSDRVVVGHASSLGPNEGLEVFLRALSLARRSDDRIAGMVVGEGPGRTSMEALASTLGIAEHVVWTGRVQREKMADYLAAYDLFVVPRPAMTLNEVVAPLKTVEAMAAGLCVVTSAVSALTDQTADTAVHVPPDDIEGLAHTLVELVQDPARRAEAGNAAKLRARAMHATPVLDTTMREALRAVDALGGDYHAHGWQSETA
jgi:glycosyltransferase involved in cell wall biosynthesis